MDKKEALAILFRSAEVYKNHMVGRNYAIIYSEKGKPVIIQTKASKSNFLHLTGLDTKLNPSEFFELCLNKRLKVEDFKFDTGGFAKLKLSVIEKVLYFESFPKMIVHFDRYRPNLYCEKIAGTIYACIGFTQINGFYIPNTVLAEDSRNFSDKPSMRILAILSKKDKELLYNIVHMVSKKCIEILKQADTWIKSNTSSEIYCSLYNKAE